MNKFEKANKLIKESQALITDMVFNNKNTPVNRARFEENQKQIKKMLCPYEIINYMEKEIKNVSKTGFIETKQKKINGLDVTFLCCYSTNPIYSMSKYKEIKALWKDCDKNFFLTMRLFENEKIIGLFLDEGEGPTDALRFEDIYYSSLTELKYRTHNFGFLYKNYE